MTGFASKEFSLLTVTGEEVPISMNIKSLNSRFFEATIKLPPELLSLEIELLKLCKQSFIRGNIYCVVYLSNPTLLNTAITPALTTVKAYVDALKRITSYLELPDPITLDHIIRLPNIFTFAQQQLDQQTKDNFLSHAQTLIDEVLQERALEGKALLADLQDRLNVITQEMVEIQAAATSYTQECKQKIVATLQEIGTQDNLLSNAQKDALYTMLDKQDIHEEIIRINSHLTHFSQTLCSSAVEKGKRLDFILQELSREINTIAAKCGESTVSTHAINSKVEVEKMREQVQNIV